MTDPSRSSPESTRAAWVAKVDSVRRLELSYKEAENNLHDLERRLVGAKAEANRLQAEAVASFLKES